MLWMLWLLVIPVLGACAFWFALGCAAARPAPKPSLISNRELRTGENREHTPKRMGRRFAAMERHQRLWAQAEAGYVGFAAQVRKRRRQTGS